MRSDGAELAQLPEGIRQLLSMDITQSDGNVVQCHSALRNIAVMRLGVHPGTWEVDRRLYYGITTRTCRLSICETWLVAFCGEVLLVCASVSQGKHR
jgi:hypothetical protein